MKHFIVVHRRRKIRPNDLTRTKEKTPPSLPSPRLTGPQIERSFSEEMTKLAFGKFFSLKSALGKL